MIGREYILKIRALDEAGVTELEERVLRDPLDLESRGLLLGYYHHDVFKHYGTDEATRISELTRDHVLWLIENAPEAEIFTSAYGHIHDGMFPEHYEVIKSAWRKQLKNNPENVTIITHAANCFTLPDEALAQELWIRAHELDPTNPKWPDQLAHAYALEGRGFTIPMTYALELARKSLEKYELAYSLSDDENKDNLVHHIAHMAIACKDYEQAKCLGKMMLQDEYLQSKDYGHFVHHGHLTLGRVALLEGDVEEAKEHLIESAKTPGSNVLCSFGPSMDLAKELVDQGEGETVLEYLQLCAVFWGHSQQYIDKWSGDIRETGTCDFSKSFSYGVAEEEEA